MKILVHPHDLGMGGSQLNAIELAGAVRDRGHDVAVYGRPGVLNARIDELGLRFVESPPPGRRPDARVVADIRRLVREDGFDVVHGYEWPPILEAHLACTGSRARAVGTVLSMAVAPFLPADLPLVVGTRQIAAHERDRGRRHVAVVEPPVDLAANHPELALDVAGFRAAHGIPDGLHVVVVSRLADQLKGEGLRTAVDVVPTLHPEAVLTVVGDGPGRADLTARAAAVNAREGRRAVVLTGEVADPRPAYAMADVTLGMGGSALRAMAFGAPLVVQGERGFWSTLTPETVAQFRWQGWYGTGDSPSDGPARLAAELLPLLTDDDERRRLGAYALEVVTRGFALPAAAGRLDDVYAGARARPRHLPGHRDVVAAGRFAAYKGARLRARVGGSAARDDFNASPAGATTRGRGPDDGPLVVWLAGVDHDAVEGTEHRLVDELSRRLPVLWVDPPTSALRHLRDPGAAPRGLTRTGPGRWRLHVVGPPGVTRPVVADVARARQAEAVRRAVAGLGATSAVAVLGAPWADASSLPVTGTVFLCTDDFVAGAELLGVDRDAVRRQLDRTMAVADVVLAVSPTLVRTLGGPTPRIRLFPNGCSPAHPADPDRPGGAGAPGPAVLVGQLNDRIDVDLLHAVADRGVPLVLVGPRLEQEAHTRAGLDRLVDRPLVTWTGRVPQQEVARHLAAAGVGLTPYRDTAFNRASFPLKTLEYLASGVRVVSTDLPASRWLDTPAVDVAGSAEEFAELAARRAREGRTPTWEATCRDVAARHSWAARADELTDVIHDLAPPRRPHLARTGAADVR